MKVTLNKLTAGGYYPETVNVGSIKWGFASETATLFIDRAEMPTKKTAFAFAQTFGLRVSFYPEFVTIEVKAEYITDILF